MTSYRRAQEGEVRCEECGHATAPFARYGRFYVRCRLRPFRGSQDRFMSVDNDHTCPRAERREERNPE